jgi:SAM-dependent methyltransferase
MTPPFGGKSFVQTVWDTVGLPLRLAILPQSALPYIGWTTLEEERLAAAWPHLRGRVLDVGAGTNTLARLYGNAVGVDVHDWGGGAEVIDNAARLPFADGSFDTVTFIACLNHIPNRGDALIEARRLLRPGGRVIVTMINPILGDVGHRIWWDSEDKHRGGMGPGEVGGMWTSEIVRLCQAAGLRLARHDRFVYWMNHLYVFEAP